jgi:hypothetical protein
VGGLHYGVGLRLMESVRLRVQEASVAGQLAGESELLHQALQAASVIHREGHHARALAAVVRQLAGESELWERALRETKRIAVGDARAEVLIALANTWRLSFDYSDFAKVLDAMSVSHRQDWLKLTQALLPVIATLGGKTVMREVADAILDTARWWP